MKQVSLRCIGVSKRFGVADAVEVLDLNVDSGTLLALVGPSGCGKTTTLRLIAGFEKPDSGAVVLGGKIVAGRGVFVPPEQRRVGMVFQEYALFPHLSVAENVAFGLPKGSDRAGRIGEALALVGLSGMGTRRPQELSGGEQQRVALARALAPSPEVLLLDEPFSNLHANLRVRVRQEVKEILRASGTTSILVTHDQEEALFMGDRVAVQNRGRLEQVDTPERIFHAPASQFVARFMGEADFIPVGPAGPLTEPRPSDALTVMARPDDVLVEPESEGSGRIVGRSFQGAFYLYRVMTDSGLMLHSLMPHTQRYPVECRVRLRLTREHRLLCFRGEKAAGHANDEVLAQLQREHALESE